MDLSWIFLVSLPVLFSPAVFGLLAFRLIIPQAKLKQSSDYVFYLPFLIFTLLSNLSLILYYIGIHRKEIFQNNYSAIFTEYSFPYFTPLKYLQAIWENVAQFFSSCPCDFIDNLKWTITDYTFFELVVELQLRAFVISILGALLIKLIIFLDDYYEAFPYENSTKSFFLKIPGQLLGYDLSSDATNNRRSVNQSGAFSKLANAINILLTNEWANSISCNRRIEILIADIKTEDDHLYSGRFVNIVSSRESDLDAISIYSPICYYPEPSSPSSEKNHSEEREIKKIESEKIGNQKFKKSNRKWRLIDKNGEFYILNKQIVTINLWTILKGAKISDNLYLGKNDYIFEKIKWHLVLLSENSNIFDSYSLFIHYDDVDKLTTFFSKLISWTDGNISNQDKIKKFTVKTVKYEKGLL